MSWIIALSEWASGVMSCSSMLNRFQASGIFCDNAFKNFHRTEKGIRFKYSLACIEKDAAAQFTLFAQILIHQVIKDYKVHGNSFR